MLIRYRVLEHSFTQLVFGGTVGAMTLGKRIRAVIDAKNKTYSWVADEVGMTPAALSNILNGVTHDPGFFTVLAIARAIEEPLSAIVDDPTIFWTNAELGRLRETGDWLVKRTTVEHAGTSLEIPRRKKGRKRLAPVHRVAASPGVTRYPDAFELPKRRIPKRFAQLHANAVFSVQGESMTREGIFPSDLLYVHRTRQTEDAVGRIVVCTVDDMILVKRLKTRGRKLILESAHRDHKPMTIDEELTRFRLIGIVVGTSRT
jgi:SOS-response transcriptional repressor LexA